MSKKLGIILSSLNDGGEPDGDEGVLASAVDAGVATAEVNEAAADVDSTTVAIEEAIDSAAELEDAAEIVAGDVESGEGLTTSGAQLAEMVTENIIDALALNHTYRRYSPVKMESGVSSPFGSKNTRLHTSKMVLEGMLETIKKIWQMVKDGAVALWQKISDFFSSFFDNAEKVKKHAKELRDKIYKLKGRSAEKSKMDSGSLANAFNDKGKVSFDSVKKILANHMGYTAATLGSVNVLGGVVTVIETAMKDPKKPDWGQLFDGVVQAMVSQSLTSGFESKKEKDGEHQIETFFQGPFIGGKYVTFRISRHKKTTDVVSVRSALDDSMNKELTTKEVPVLKIDEMINVCEMCEQLSEATENYKKKKGDIEAIGKNAIKMIEGIIGTASAIVDAAEENSAIKEKMAILKNATNDLIGLASRMAIMLPSMNVTAGNQALAYVSESAKQYVEKK